MEMDDAMGRRGQRARGRSIRARRFEQVLGSQDSNSARVVGRFGFSVSDDSGFFNRKYEIFCSLCWRIQRHD